VTEAEYNRALELSTPRLIFLMSDKHPVMPADVETGDGAEKLKKFKERLQKDRVVGFFDSADDLKAKVIQALIPYCNLARSAVTPSQSFTRCQLNSTSKAVKLNAQRSCAR
jgi:hypothetical protein